MGKVSSTLVAWYKELVDVWNLLSVETRNKWRAAYHAIEGAFAGALTEALGEAIIGGGLHKATIHHALSSALGAALIAYRALKVTPERVVFTDEQRALLKTADAAKAAGAGGA